MCITSILLAQDEGHSKCSDLPDALKEYLDPNYPVFIQTEDKLSNELDYKSAMKSYAASHKPFPEYQNSGKKRRDNKSFIEAKEQWHKNTPYFPQFIDTGYPEIDKHNYEKARREWINHHPKEYKELFEAVYNDDELLENYYFIID